MTRFPDKFMVNLVTGKKLLHRAQDKRVSVRTGRNMSSENDLFIYYWGGGFPSRRSEPVLFANYPSK